MRKFLAVVLLALVLGACATPKSPQQQLAVMELTFTGIVDQLTQARIEGVITDTELWRCAQTVIQATDATIDAARAMLLRRQSIAAVLGNLQARIRSLRRLHSTGENICELSSSDTSNIRRDPIGLAACHDVQRDRGDNGRRRKDRTDPRGMGPDQVEA